MSRVLFYCLFFLPFFLVAQTDKGRLLLGGNIDMSFFRQDKRSQFNFAVRPSVGVFVFRNFALGGSYQFGISSNSEDKAQVFSSSIGPYVKYYIGKKMVKGYVAVLGGYQVRTRIKDGGVGNLNGFYAGGNVGVAYFFNPYVALESGLFLNASGFEGLYPATRFGLGIGVQVFLDVPKEKK